MKQPTLTSAPRDKQRLVISIIGWIIELIDSISQKSKVKSRKRLVESQKSKVERQNQLT